MLRPRLRDKYRPRAGLDDCSCKRFCFFLICIEDIDRKAVSTHLTIHSRSAYKGEIIACLHLLTVPCRGWVDASTVVHVPATTRHKHNSGTGANDEGDDKTL